MSLDATRAHRWIELATADVAEQRNYLVDLDRAIGDGDHGKNMDHGFEAATEALGQAQPGSVIEVLKTVAEVLISMVDDAAGSLYGAAFLCVLRAAGDGELGGADAAAVIVGALDGIQVRDGATTGGKTMVDVRTPALEVARAAVKSGSDDAAASEATVTAAETRAVVTEPSWATRGHVPYLGEYSTGYLDPGAVPVPLILRAAMRVADETGAT